MLGMSDYYRDRVRHGGILSNTFIGKHVLPLLKRICWPMLSRRGTDFWWNRQVVSNQYGLAGRAARNWGSDTLEGSLSEQELKSLRQSQPDDTVRYKFRDEEYYQSKDFNLSDIEVPLLSVANWVSFLSQLQSYLADSR